MFASFKWEKLVFWLCRWAALIVRKKRQDVKFRLAQLAEAWKTTQSTNWSNDKLAHKTQEWLETPKKKSKT